METQETSKPVTVRSLYLGDFKLTVVAACFLVTCTLTLFTHPLKELLNSWVLKPLFKDAEYGVVTDLICVAVLLWAVYSAKKKFDRNLYPSLNSVIVGTCVISWYILIFRLDPIYYFYHFHCGWLSNIYYVDLLLIAVILYFVDYRTYHLTFTTVKSKLSLIEDLPSLTAYSDAYSRKKYAGDIAGHINATTTVSSFAIGIIGEWGSGKTDFLLRLKETLQKEQANLIVDFNPWRVGKPEGIVDDFFKTLAGVLKPFNHSITGKIKDYSKKILQTGKEVQFRLFDTMINELFNDQSVQEQYEDINRSIKLTGKRLIIVIDDLDRLTGKEVMEVLRIIRNTANFSNTFFIAGLDQQYIVNVLHNTKDFFNEEEYLKKVFQLTISLPAFKNEVLIEEISRLLITDDLPADEKKVIREALGKISKNSVELIPYFPAANHEDITEKLLSNVRDLKRFCNSFKIAFNILFGEVDINDLMVLELIRNRNLEVYNALRDRRLLAFDQSSPDEFILDKAGWDAFAKKNKGRFDKNEFAKLKAAVEFLVMDVGYKNRRKFVKAHNFYLYFSYQLFDLISLAEFAKIMEKDKKEITKQFDDWTKEGKKDELHRIVNDLVDFKDSGTLLGTVEAYLNVKNDHSTWLLQAEKLIFALRKFNDNKYFNEKPDDHKKFLKNLMKNQRIDVTDRIYLAFRFLDGYVHPLPDGDLVLARTEWQAIMLELFKSYLKTLKKVTADTLTNYYYNAERIDEETNRVIIHSKASLAFKAALRSDQTLFEGYLHLFIRPYGSHYRSHGELIFEPYFEQIFGNYKNFKKILEDYAPVNKDNKRLKAIILKVFDEFITSNKAPFKIKDSRDRVFVEKIMKATGAIKENH